MFSSVILFALINPSFAQDIEPAIVAEVARLQSEMQRLASRETWSGVEGLYHRLLALESKGIELTYAEHMLGAQAARALGNVAATRTRLLRALALWETSLARNWLTEIDQRYGTVSVRVPNRQRESYTLAISQMPFQSDQRFAIDFARDAILEDAFFEGYIPIGQYTLGEVGFTVTADQPVELELSGRRRAGGQAQPADEVAAAPATAPATAPAPLNPAPSSARGFSGHLRFAAGLGSVGAARSAGVEPLPFQGLGLRGGLGGTVGISDALGVGIVVGGQSVQSGQNAAGLGHLWAFASLHWDRWTVEAGPALSAGRAKVTGLDRSRLLEFCNELNASTCASLARDASADQVVVRGQVRASGGVLGLTKSMMSTGPVDWELGLELSALSDGARMYSGGWLGVVTRFGGAR